MNPAGRVQALDGLRGLAALSVVLYHVSLRYPRFMHGLQMDDTPLFPGFSQAEAGVVPVLWFFLLSGFVITWTVDRCRTPMDFVVSRATRLYPAYWAALAITLAVAALWPLPGPVPEPMQVLANLTMAQEYLGFPNVDGVYWSLGVELLFYVYALALLATGLWRQVHRVALAWAVACLAAALVEQAGVPVPWRASQVLLLNYGPFLAAGMMLYRLGRGQHRAWSVATLAVCGAAVLAGYRPVPAASCFLVAGAIGVAARGGVRWLGARPLLWLGSISYSLYLSHQSASFAVIRSLDARGVPHWVGMAAGVVVALALAAAITALVEQPALRALRGAWRRWQPPGSGFPAVVPAAHPGAPGSPG